ncbi:MAG: aldo/keto reductase [Spirochaetes bacterium]|nr:aldo/keto reductase [Spirochaetota bacterium]
MKYRTIGKTDMAASVIGLGGEHLATGPYETVETVVNTALDLGINIIDVFMPGKTARENFGRALGGRRQKTLIQGHICSTDINEQYDVSRHLPTVQKYFDDLLKCLKTDYIDIGMLFFVDSEKDFSDVFEGEILPYAQNLKKKGIIRAIGASCHNPVTAKRIVETGAVDLIMFSINPAFDMAPAQTDILNYLEDAPMDFEKKLDKDRAALYRLCEQRQVSITVMKAFAAGKLLSPKHTPFNAPMTAAQCIHYALTRPAVASAIIGCSNKEEVLEAAAYLDKSESELDYSAVLKDFQGDFRGNCVYCSHCQPCPAALDIAGIHKYLDIALLDAAAVPPSVAAGYRALGRAAGECAACGDCERRCPFSVPVIENMKKAAALFENRA